MTLSYCSIAHLQHGGGINVDRMASLSPQAFESAVLTYR